MFKIKISKFFAISAFVLIAIAFILPLHYSFAQISTSTVISQDNSALIKQLQALITSLQSQINELKAKLEITQIDLAKVKEEVRISRNLSLGISGDDVKYLQEVLKEDPEIYPEGLITGFFGQKTAAAVKKFQEKHGIEAIGIIGPKTRQKLNELIAQRAERLGNIPSELIGVSEIQEKLIPRIPESVQPTILINSIIPAMPAQLVGQTGTTTIPAIPVLPGTTTMASTTIFTPFPTLSPSLIPFVSISPVPSNTPAPISSPIFTPTPSPSPTGTTTTTSIASSSPLTASPSPSPSPSYSPSPSPSPSSITLPAPTYIRADWYTSWPNYRDNNVGQQIVFQYPSDSNSKTTTFRFYEKNPAVSAFSLIGEFSGFNSTSCTANGTRVYAGGWGLIGAPWNSCQYWSVLKNPTVASSYLVGEYSYYVTAVDSSGKEGIPSVTVKQIFFEPLTIISPTSVQSPVSSVPTFQWILGSGWPSNISGQAPLLFTIAVFDSLTAANPFWTSNINGVSSPGTNSKVYDGPALDSSKKYRLTINGWGSQSATGPSYMALPSATADFWITTATTTAQQSSRDSLFASLSALLASLQTALATLMQ